MQILKPNSAYYGGVTTRKFSTGVKYDASAITAEARKNGIIDASFVLTVTNIGTGKYKITGTVPNTYSDGDNVLIEVNVTVDGVDDAIFADVIQVVSASQADIKSDTSATFAKLPTNKIMGSSNTNDHDTDLTNIKADTAAILLDTGTDGVVVAAGSKTGYSLAADQSGVTIGTANAIAAAGRAAIADDVFDEALAGHAGAGTTGKAISDILDDTGTSGVVLPQAQADKVWGTAARALTDKAGFSLAADQSGVTVGTVTTITNKIDFVLSDACRDDVVDKMFDELFSGHNVAGSLGCELHKSVQRINGKITKAGDVYTIFDLDGITTVGTQTVAETGTVQTQI